MKFLTISFSIIAFISMAFYVKKSTSSIPDHWQKGMVLSYMISHSMSGIFSKYEFSDDSIHVHTRVMSGNGHQEEKYSKPLTSVQLDNLLKMLKDNKIDKMRMSKTEQTIYDGAAYGLQLRKNDKFIINLSNSANEEMSEKDAAKFWSVIKHIESLARK